MTNPLVNMAKTSTARNILQPNNQPIQTLNINRIVPFNHKTHDPANNTTQKLAGTSYVNSFSIRRGTLLNKRKHQEDTTYSQGIKRQLFNPNESLSNNIYSLSGMSADIPNQISNITPVIHNSALTIDYDMSTNYTEIDNIIRDALIAIEQSDNVETHLSNQLDQLKSKSSCYNIQEIAKIFYHIKKMMPMLILPSVTTSLKKKH